MENAATGGGLPLLDDDNVSEGEWSGFDSDSVGSDIEIHSDISSVSDVSSVHSSDLSDFDSDVELERGPQNWRVNDRTAIPKVAFTGPQPGATIILGPDENELSFFELFFSDDLVDHLVGQTNLYARQKIAVKADKNWREVTSRDMKAYLGIRVYMSILRLPQTAMYWSKDQMFGNLAIRRVMKRDRFDKIQQYLHLADRRQNPQKGQPGHDKLHLVRPVLQDVLDKCLLHYNPHQNQSVDEAMVKFRGRLSFRQYMPAKPTKYGIKLWMRANPENGYTHEFQVYTGKENNTPEVGLSTRVVLDMSRKIWGRNHIVNIDNYFTSPDLLKRLLKQKTYARGTVRQNRKEFPKQMLQKKDVKQQGEYKTAQKGELTATVWMDKKPIFMLSTAEDPATIASTVQRKSRGGEPKEVPAPSVIQHYNNNMNGVDVADQLRTEYCTYRTSKKWWRYLFWFLFDVAVTNGFVMMRESAGHQQRSKNNRVKARTVVDFRTNLAKQLIGDYTDNERAALATISAGHYVKKGERRGRCRQCAKKKCRRDIIYICGQCNVHLCPTNCFEQYHRDVARN